MQKQGLVAASASAFFAALLLADPARAVTVNVSVQNFQFSPNDVTIHAGDTVHWTNNAGTHSVTADDNSFNSGINFPFTFDHTFNAAGTVFYHCAVHSQAGVPINQGMNGRVVVLANDPPPFQINQGIAGTWYNPQKGGQGFLFDIRPSDKFMFVAWFTFDTAMPAAGIGPKLIGAPEQRWFTIQGTYGVDKAENASIFSTSGGVFDTVKPVTNTAVGTATVTFTSCTAGTVAYNIPGDNLTGTISITRAIPGTENICTLLATPAAPQ